MTVPGTEAAVRRISAPNAVHYEGLRSVVFF